MSHSIKLRAVIRWWLGCGLIVLFMEYSAAAQPLSSNPYAEPTAVQPSASNPYAQPARVQGASADPYAQQIVKPRLLVLTTGRVVNGRIEPGPGGYMLHSATGEMFIPFTQVKLTALSLTDAYRKLRTTMPEQTASQHVMLAQWCLANRLYGHAQAEVQEALVLEPTRRDARQLLRRLEELTNPERGLHLKPIKSAPRTFDGFLNERPQALAGLNPQTASLFITKVQPLLKNKCGNASCHGPSAPNNFHLTPVVNFRGSRSISEKNLQEVLKHLNLDQPAQSPLLTTPLSRHGLRGTEVFRGRVGEEQKQLLYNWVLLLSQEKANLAGNLQGNSTSTIQQVSGTQPQHGSTSAVSPSSLNAPNWPPSGSTMPRQFPQQSINRFPTPPGVQPPSQSRFLNEVLQQERPDAFDPNEFNSKNRSGISNGFNSSGGIRQP